MSKSVLPYVEADEPSFFAKRTPAYVMEDLHQHNDLEVNFLVSGRVSYLFRGGLLDLPQGRLVVFWGSTPHRIVDVAAGSDLMTAQVPAAWIMDWDLPHAFVERFLAGRFITERNPSRAELDQLLMDTWADDFVDPFSGNRDPFKTSILEMRARIQRLAASALEDVDQLAFGPYSSSLSWKHVEEIAHYMAEHFAEPLSISDIAEAVGLKPSYAMHLFKDRCGVSLLAYLNNFRLAHAQHLLAASDATVLDIALESGFGSLSRFYAVFKKACGVSPARYRRAFRR
jgi:AraC family transcriptional regulator, melibiose operon regulatory protein